MTILSVRPILRSRHARRPGLVLSTYIMTYPRWIHAEGKTHRAHSIDEEIEVYLRTPSLMDSSALSRNAASSRAIPVERVIQDVIDNPADPLFWGENQRGMQAWHELTGDRLDHAKGLWEESKQKAIDMAWQMARAKVHKQIVNRILEPYSHIRTLVSATEWKNYIALRAHPDAEPHIRMLAESLKVELEREDNIQTLRPDQWHMPFTDITDKDGEPVILDGAVDSSEAMMNSLKLSVSRNASLSYKTVDGIDMSLDRACRLHDDLISRIPIHASPAEHTARADHLLKEPVHAGGMLIEWCNQNQHANFRGFRQYRHMIEGNTMIG